MHDHTVQICEIEKPYHHEFVLAKDDDEEKKRKKTSTIKSKYDENLN
mgnify:CR=1 FL=1